MPDGEGLENCAIGLNKIKSFAEEKGVTVNLELLNSKVNHKDYMADHSAWGVELMKRVNSPRIKLLFDIYHMQIMEGDLIRTIRENIAYFGHFHTGGNPGRHEIDDTQEVNWKAVAKAIADQPPRTPAVVKRGRASSGYRWRLGQESGLLQTLMQAFRVGDPAEHTALHLH